MIEIEEVLSRLSIEERDDDAFFNLASSAFDEKTVGRWMYDRLKERGMARAKSMKAN